MQNICYYTTLMPRKFANITSELRAVTMHAILNTHEISRHQTMH